MDLRHGQRVEDRGLKEREEIREGGWHLDPPVRDHGSHTGTGSGRCDGSDVHLVQVTDELDRRLVRVHPTETRDVLNRQRMLGVQGGIQVALDKSLGVERVL